MIQIRINWDYVQKYTCSIPVNGKFKLQILFENNGVLQSIVSNLNKAGLNYKFESDKNRVELQLSNKQSLLLNTEGLLIQNTL